MLTLLILASVIAATSATTHPFRFLPSSKSVEDPYDPEIIENADIYADYRLHLVITMKFRNCIHFFSLRLYIELKIYCCVVKMLNMARDKLPARFVVTGKVMSKEL